MSPAPARNEARRPVCLNVVPTLDPAAGGMATSLPECSAAVNATGWLEDQIIALSGWRKVPFGNNYSSSNLPDLLHIHGLWQPHCHGSAQAARRLRLPYMISAHGMLEPWALAQKKWKKQLYAAWRERPNLRRATVLRALTEVEAEDYRRFGLTNPIVLIPNGVEPAPALSPDLFWGQYPHLRQQPFLLFLGRLHPKKGVDLLCRAFARVRPLAPEWHLVIAGPDSGHTQASLAALARELGVATRVTFTGLLSREQKASALAAARCYVLPSHSEGFSMAALEALAAGVPALVTRQCHLPEVSVERCGWEAEPTVDSLEQALCAVVACSTTDLAARGARGRALVERRFRWQPIGQQLAEVYQWMLGGPAPVSCPVWPGKTAR